MTKDFEKKKKKAFLKSCHDQNIKEIIKLLNK